MYPNNKRAQGMIVDLILLVLISSLFFIFLGTQMVSTATETGAIRNRNSFTQKLLLSTVNYASENFGNVTIADLIVKYHCKTAGVNDTFLNAELNSLMAKLNKADYYFILNSIAYGGTYPYNQTYACSPEVNATYGSCCVKTEKVNVAVLELNLVCGNNATVTLGVWPKNMKVEPC